MDQACDGLVAKPGDSQAPDTWEHGTTNTIFDGDCKKAKLSEADYGKAFASADEKYARHPDPARGAGVEGRVVAAESKVYYSRPRSRSAQRVTARFARSQPGPAQGTFKGSRSPG